MPQSAKLYVPNKDIIRKTALFEKSYLSCFWEPIHVLHTKMKKGKCLLNYIDYFEYLVCLKVTCSERNSIEIDSIVISWST